MQKLKIIITASFILLLSCNKAESSANKDLDDLCTFDLMRSTNTLDAKSNAAIINWPRWQSGQTIKIKFLDGDKTQHEKVKKHAAEWTNYANLKFEYVPQNEYADIRIGFDKAGDSGNEFGAWSELGMESVYGTPDHQSMRLGSLKSIDESSVRRTILHEFGHSLGLVHETTNPSANIKWDLPKVYDYYNEWSEDQVNQWVINKSNSTNYSEYDPLSIMHYYIPASLTTNKIAVNQMSSLSDIDKKSINEWYAFPIVSILKSGQNLNNLPWKDRIKSPNGKYSFEFVPGLFRVINLDTNEIIWQAGNETYKRKAFGYFESNGNLTLRGAKTPLSTVETIWTSNTPGLPNAVLELNDDGNLQIIENGAIKWSSKGK